MPQRSKGCRDPPVLRVWMPAPGLKKALDSSKELEITVTGRKSGKKITLPIWFVRDGEKLLFLPVRGSESNWYRNVKHSPTMGISAGGTSMTAKARPTESAERDRAAAEKLRVDRKSTRL